MSPFTLTLALVLAVSAGPSTRAETPRKPNPLAPSLPQLTDEEEEQFDKVIDRFIQFDTGQLGGAEGRQALADFQKLPPEAVFALIRGLNRAAAIDYSCPAVTISKKLTSLLAATDDLELLEFARENIGAGVTRTKHSGLLRDLRVRCMVRKRVVLEKTALARNNPRPAAPQPNLRTMSTSQLLREAGRGLRREQVVRELEQRPRDQVLSELASVAGDPSDSKGRQSVRDVLDGLLSRQPAKVVKDKLKDDMPEVRMAAARVAGGKRLACGGELIDLLADDNDGVRQAAHDALVRLSRGTDFGPAAGADEAERAAAVRKWRSWWEKAQRK